MVASGTDLLVVCVGAKPNVSSPVVTVEWDGVALTQLDYSLSSDDAYSAIFYKVNPTATTANIVTEFANTTSGLIHVIMNYSNVDTSDPFGTTAKDNAVEGTSIDIDIASAVGNYVLGLCCVKANTSINCSQTEIAEVSDPDQPTVASCSETTAVGSSTNMAYSWSLTNNNSCVGAVINAATSSSSSSSSA